MSLERLERMVVEELGSKDDLALVVSALLEQARIDLEKEYIHGKYMTAGALRFDGLGTNGWAKHCKSALFAAVPYFTLAEAARSNSKPPSNTHPARTLLQSAYASHSTATRDNDQFLHKKIGRGPTSGV